MDSSQRLILLAQENPFMRMGERFREGEATVDLVEGLLLLTTVLTTGVVVWLLNRWIGPGSHRPTNSPEALFRQLCRAHRLSSRQVRFLRRLAMIHQLDHPACIFVDAALFDSARGEISGHLSETGIDTLRGQLYGISP